MDHTLYDLVWSVDVNCIADVRELIFGDVREQDVILYCLTARYMVRW